jgi:hypothetical protein
MPQFNHPPFICLQVLWLYGGPGQALEYAAKPLCMRFGENATAQHWDAEVVAAANADAAAASAALGSINTLSAQAGHPWRQGSYQSASRQMGLSYACTAAMQAYVWGLEEMPALLRVPLGAVLPLPAFSVHALASHGHARAAAAAAHAAGGGSHDSLVALADPFAGTWLHGWVDGDALVVPSHAGIAFATMMLLATLMGIYAVLLYSAEVLQEQGPKLRRRCGWQGAGVKFTTDKHRHDD